MQDKNSIYEPPQSELDDKPEVEIPEAILKKIRAGWIAALISAAVTFILMLVFIRSGDLGDLFDIWSTFDVILILVLAFGIYKKSRIAATLMLLYFLLSKILIIVETGRPSGLLLSVIFLYFYFQAMVGTFQYHKLIKSHVKADKK